MNSPRYYLGNGMVWQGKLFYMSTKNYTKEVLRQYQEKFGSLAKENMLPCPKEKLELDDTLFVDEVKHNEYQYIIGVCQWLIIAGIFDLTHTVSSLSRFVALPQEGYLILARKVFGHLKKYLKYGYAINPMPLRLNMEYKKVEIKISYGNQ
eukprot:2933520-Ditylum_brightwellii.AAC.1